MQRRKVTDSFKQARTNDFKRKGGERFDIIGDKEKKIEFKECREEGGRGKGAWVGNKQI